MNYPDLARKSLLVDVGNALRCVTVGVELIFSDQHIMIRSGSGPDQVGAEVVYHQLTDASDAYHATSGRFSVYANSGFESHGTAAVAAYVLCMVLEKLTQSGSVQSRIEHYSVYPIPVRGK